MDGWVSAESTSVREFSLTDEHFDVIRIAPPLYVKIFLLSLRRQTKGVLTHFLCGFILQMRRTSEQMQSCTVSPYHRSMAASRHRKNRHHRFDVPCWLQTPVHRDRITRDEIDTHIHALECLALICYSYSVRNLRLMRWAQRWFLIDLITYDCTSSYWTGSGVV